MNVKYDGQDAFAAAANGDFPLVVLLWGMALAAQPQRVDLLTATDAHGNTVLHCASAVALDGNVAILHFLLQQATAAGRHVGEIVNARNQAGETPIIRAAHIGNLRMVDALLTVGQADIAACDKDGNTAAHHAASEGQLWVLHYLLEAELRMSPDRAVGSLGGLSKNQCSVLHYACARERKVVIQYLVARGFDPDQCDVDDTSPLAIATRGNLKWLVKMLQTQDPTLTQPPTACRQTRLWVVLLYGALFCGVLSSSYFAPYWVALPIIAVVLWQGWSKLNAPHKHSGHSHGAPSKNPESVHPSKRSMAVPANVSLGQSRAAPQSVGSVRKSISSMFKPQPELFMGVWMAWVMLFTVFYVAVVVDPRYAFLRTNQSRPYLVALGVVEVLFLVAWARLAVICPSDPGVIHSFKTDITDMLEKAAEGFPPPAASHCRTCLIRKPIRSKHCAQCGVCVARMDHHCGWINRCVGYGNHRLFVIFVTLHVLVVASFVGLTIVAFHHLVHPDNVDEAKGSTTMRVWMQLPTLFSDHLLAVMVFAWGNVAVAGLFSMLLQHLGNMTRNMTVNEQINWRRYSYLQSGTSLSDEKRLEKKKMAEMSEKISEHKLRQQSPVMMNPFDRGAMSNVAEFWVRSGSASLNYRATFQAPTRMHSVSGQRETPAELV